MFSVPSDVNLILEKLRENGFEAYLVGGCVRDFFMGKAPNDFDVATNALPDSVENIFSFCRTFTEGKKHGTVGVISGNYKVEITTYRTDIGFVNNRFPDRVKFETKIENDLMRRDFTINAMAFDGKNVIDLYGGQNDIENRIIRAVGNPDTRFEEDALRIMRALRFSSTLQFDIEPCTKAAIMRSCHLLKNISKERITGELSRLICGADAEKIIEEYSDVFDVFIPGFARMHAFDQRNKYHIYDLLTHTAKTVALCGHDPVTRLAALLHDIGKTVAVQEEETGYRHFKGHPEASLTIAKAALDNLALKNADKEAVLFLVRFHDETVGPDRPGVKRWLNRWGAENMLRLCDLKNADANTHSEIAEGMRKTAKLLTETVNAVLSGKECYSIPMLDISGNDLTAIGISGKAVGDMLETLLYAVIDEKVENSREALIAFAKNL